MVMLNIKGLFQLLVSDFMFRITQLFPCIILLKVQVINYITVIGGDRIIYLEITYD